MAWHVPSPPFTLRAFRVAPRSRRELYHVTCPVTPSGYPRRMVQITSQTPTNIKDSEWVGFPGGELEGKRPKALCPACREDLGRILGTRRTDDDGPALPARRTLCFQCYRAEIDRAGALKAAGQLDTASAERFQTALPFEPVNRPRLEMLKVERSAARASMLATSAGRFADRRRQAQIAARHALQRIAAGLAAHGVWKSTPGNDVREMAAAIHAAELQLPESWLPFVVSR